MTDEPRDDEDGKCGSCHVRPAEPLHPCPYREEINDDLTECNCCAKCRQNCCDEI